MARHNTLLAILNMLRAEARLSLSPAHNRQVRDSHIILLQRIQERLWDDFTWPHLRVQRMKPCSIKQRYYSPPSDIRIDNIEKVEVFDNGGWQPLAPGIYGEHYSGFNSDLNQTSWPVMRWQIHEDEDIEIWPLSNIDGNKTTLHGMLKFTGIRDLKPFVKDSDRADLDDNLLVMFAAAELLAAQGAKDAQLKLDQATQIYRRQRSGLTPRSSFRMFNIGKYVPRPQEFVVYNVKGGSIPGPAGVPGSVGQRGSIWTTGSGPPSSSAASLTGDMYLNEATGDVWRFDGAVWVQRSDVLGP